MVVDGAGGGWLWPNGYGLMGVVGGLTAGVGCVRFWYNNGCIDTLREVGD